jgi:hypothetical protein
MTRPVRSTSSPGVQILIVAQQDDADFVLVHVERDAQQAAGELHQFFEPHAGQAGNRGDAGGDVRDDAHFMRSQVAGGRLRGLTQVRERPIDAVCTAPEGVIWPRRGTDFAGRRARLVSASAALACGRGLGFQQRADLPVERREIVRDAPANLLPVRRQFDPADRVRVSNRTRISAEKVSLSAFWIAAF